MKYRHKIKKIIFLLIVLGAIAAVGSGCYLVLRVAEIGAAYKAKLLCSGIFVAKRDAASILNADVVVDDLSVLRHFDVDINYETNKVTASFFGLVKRQAVFHPGRGCSLVYDAEAQHSVEGSAAAAVLLPLLPEKYADHFDPVLDWAFAEPDPQRLRRTRAVVILHKGKIAAERYAPGFDRDILFLGWSMTKSVVNALVGIMVKKGQLSLAGSLPVPEWQSASDPRRGITLDHLLHMTSGLSFNEDYRNPLNDVNCMLLSAPDMGGYALRKAPAAEPGRQWKYSSGSTNIICRLMREILRDSSYPEFPRRELFYLIGMTSAIIEPDASGTFVGSSFMYATARDWAKFGQLYLQDGLWSGQRILPAGWVKYTTTPEPKSPDQGYGAHFWLKIPKEYRIFDYIDELPADAFHCIGYEGQFISIIPSLNLVVVRLGLTRYPSSWPHDKFLLLVTKAAKRENAGK